MFRNIRPFVDGPIIRLFGTDGVSRLVHYELDANGNVLKAENVTRNVQADIANRVFGYFDFEQPYGGRVYTYLSVIKESDGNLRVYGTNGGELVEFTRSPTGAWRVWQSHQQCPQYRGCQHAPHSSQCRFRCPGAYINSLGERHILQINGDGEIVEYFTLADDPTKQIRTQNINLRVGETSKITNLRYRAEAPVIPKVLEKATSYRVNAGGDLIVGVPAWTADTGGSPSANSNTLASQSRTSSTSAVVDLTHPSIPAGTPSALFQPNDGISTLELKWLGFCGRTRPV